MRQVARFLDRMAAEGAKSALAASDIEAVLSGGDLGGANPFLAPVFGVDVLVDVEDLAQATEILAAAEARAPSRQTKSYDTPRLARFRLVLVALWGVEAFGLIVALFSHDGLPAGVAMTTWLLTGLLAPALSLVYVAMSAKARRRRYAAADDAG